MGGGALNAAATLHCLLRGDFPKVHRFRMCFLQKLFELSRGMPSTRSPSSLLPPPPPPWSFPLPCSMLPFSWCCCCPCAAPGFDVCRFDQAHLPLHKLAEVRLAAVAFSGCAAAHSSKAWQGL